MTTEPTTDTAAESPELAPYIHFNIEADPTDTETSENPPVHPEAPLIVLLHGFLQTAKYWNPARKGLTAAGYRVAAIDLLGFGDAAEVEADSYGYRAHVAHVKSAIEQINEGQPVILVGHSMGGLIAMKLARYYPELVSQLIICNAPLFRDSDEARDSIVGTNRVYQFLMTSKYRNIGWGAARVLTRPVCGRHNPEARDGALEQVIFRGNGLSDLQQLTVPTVLVAGEQDRHEYLENLEEVQLNDNIRVVVVPTGHHTPAVAPHYLVWIMAKLSGEQLTPAEAVAAVTAAASAN